jgi:hypothetical protein
VEIGAIVTSAVALLTKDVFSATLRSWLKAGVRRHDIKIIVRDPSTGDSVVLSSDQVSNEQLDDLVHRVVARDPNTRVQVEQSQGA